MASFRSIKQWLFGSARSAGTGASSPGAVVPLPLAADVIAKCRIEHAADTAAFIPGSAPGLYDLAPAEQAAQDHLAAHARSTDDEFTARLAELERSGHSLAKSAAVDFSGLELHAKTEIAKLQAELAPELENAARDMWVAERGKSHFKTSNGIAREPHESETSYRFLLLTWAAIVTEASVNIGALAPAMKAGVAEAFLTALALALVNVGGSFGFALWIRELWSRRKWRRALGGLAVLSYALTLAEWTMLLGFYRLVLGAGSEHPGVDAAMALRDMPAAAVSGSLEAIVLMAVTVAASITTVCATLLWRDPIPGYHRVQARLNRARGAWQSAQARYHRGLRSLFMRMAKDVEQSCDKTQQTFDEVRSVARSMEALVDGYDRYCDGLPRVMEAVSVHYRQRLATVGGFDVAEYQGKWSFGERVDVTAIRSRITGFQQCLNSLSAAGVLAKAAEQAQIEITRVEGEAIKGAPEFFADCKDDAIAGIARATSEPSRRRPQAIARRPLQVASFKPAAE